MTDDELAQIAARVEQDDIDAYWNGLSDAYEQAASDRAALLADNLRLRAREAASVAEREQWRGVVEIMAKGPISWHPEYGHICTCCDAAWIDGDPDDDQPGAIQHTSDCAVVQARALLAATEPTDATTAE